MRYRLRTLLMVLAMAPAIVWVSTVKLAEFIDRTRTYEANQSPPEPRQPARRSAGPRRGERATPAADEQINHSANPVGKDDDQDPNDPHRRIETGILDGIDKGPEPNS